MQDFHNISATSTNFRAFAANFLNFHLQFFRGFQYFTRKFLGGQSVRIALALDSLGNVFLWPKTAAESRVVQTRLLSSGGKFNQPCNVFDGAFPAQAL